MITILSDHDIEGYAALLWKTVIKQGWAELLFLELVTFQEVDLPFDILHAGTT